MIHPDEAVALMRSFLREPATETVPLAAALGRLMPRPAVGTVDQPPFDKAAMDGWAWAPAPGESLPAAPLRVREVIAAGHSPWSEAIARGDAARIMTGAPLPAGASRVQRVEWSEESGGSVRFTKPERASNVIRRGENARAGDTILSPRALSAQDIAILAADGRASVEVARKLTIGVLSTGAELAEPGEALTGARIYDSNRPQILAQLASPAFETRDLGRLPDELDATIAAVRDALASCDVVILSGGVSMGDFDYVPRALAAAGVAERFHGVAMKPGKPTYFGTTDASFVFGLPGNPVSVFVNVDFLVKPLLYALSGVEYRPLDMDLRLLDDIQRKDTERVEFLPIRLTAEGASLVRYGGSSALQALATADGFVRLERGQAGIAKGGLARARIVR